VANDELIRTMEELWQGSRHEETDMKWMDHAFDEDWESSRELEVDTEGSLVRRGYNCMVKAKQRSEGGEAEKQSFEKQMLDVSMELTEAIRGMARFKDDNDDEEQSDKDIVKKEVELSERFRKIRYTQLRVRGEGTDRTQIMLAVDQQVREVMQEWKRYWGEHSSLTNQDIFPWKVLALSQGV